MRSHYDVLAVSRDATAQEIKDARDRLAKRHHPDSGGDLRLMQGVNEAYRVLSNPQLRASYDETLGPAVPSSGGARPSQERKDAPWADRPKPPEQPTSPVIHQSRVEPFVFCPPLPWAIPVLVFLVTGTIASGLGAEVTLCWATGLACAGFVHVGRWAVARRGWRRASGLRAFR